MGEQYLLLHRTSLSNDEAWAWTPPSGVCLPGESIEECARRELKEETGLELEPNPTNLGTADWFVYLAESGPDDHVVLGPEHDTFRWVSIERAIEMCRPDRVAAPFRSIAEEGSGGDLY